MNTLQQTHGHGNQLIRIGDTVRHIKDSTKQPSEVTRINPDGTIWTSGGRGDAKDFVLIHTDI